MSYRHTVIARREIANGLAIKTESGMCSEEETVEIGGMLLHKKAAGSFL